MDGKSCLFCKHSRFGNLEKADNESVVHNKIFCEIHGFVPQDKANACKEYDEGLK